ncbi:aminotransferase class V-fold PLP-dependent enzyme [Streptomyces sp. ISL-44]|uniref:aminotransferase class V-fold PLP-dependent enzyme n=1 Tax=Streptomyces sp. ISL-44 TaxID=2819184 RepID=UPI0020356585|nr:aminotransferase class V-fold PLP-dependent enzyme [Streptomyces sp. ISL-44]
MAPHLTHFFGNRSSSHAYGAEPRRALADARAQVAALIGGRPEEVVFTGSGSEADLLALRGAVLACGHPHPHVITQATEHPAVLDLPRPVTPARCADHGAARGRYGPRGTGRSRGGTH